MSGPEIKAGLEDVVATQSEICFIDGVEGRLLYYGYDIAELAERSSFEETAFLLWNGRLPSRIELEEIRAQFRQGAQLPEPVQAILRSIPRDATPMEVLRTCVSALGHFDPDSGDQTIEARRRKAVRITARMATIVSGFDRLRRGAEPVAARPDFGMAANFLYMLFGHEPRVEFARAMDVAFILHAEHGMNASTFTGRVVISTLSDVFSACTAAIGALKGPLHGGANEEVIRMLEEIGSPERAQPYVLERLARKARIPGFGHRVYKTEDPRAAILRRSSESLGRLMGDLRWYETTVAVERVMRAHSKVFPNVDLYSASVYRAMGIPQDLFTSIFAIGRAPGWLAHAMEQWANNRLIRPRDEYVGPARRPYVPLEER